MKCPSCNSTNNIKQMFSMESFKHAHYHCNNCDAEWSKRHNKMFIVKDPNETSFMSTGFETTEVCEYAVMPI